MDSSPSHSNTNSFSRADNYLPAQSPAASTVTAEAIKQEPETETSSLFANAQQVRIPQAAANERYSHTSIPVSAVSVAAVDSVQFANSKPTNEDKARPGKRKWVDRQQPLHLQFPAEWVNIAPKTVVVKIPNQKTVNFRLTADMAVQVPKYKAFFADPARQVLFDTFPTPEIAEIDIAIFADFFHSLEYGTMNHYKVNPMGGENKWYHACKVYVLATQKKCVTVKNVVSSYLYSYAIGTGKAFFPPNWIVNYAYHFTEPGAGIRRLLVAQRIWKGYDTPEGERAGNANPNAIGWMRYTSEEESMDEELSGYDFEFLSELAGKAIRTVHEQRSNFFQSAAHVGGFTDVE